MDTERITDDVERSMLNEYCSKRIPVTVYILNGVQMHGIISRHDSRVIVLEANNRENTVYKHAIYSISPEMRGKPVHGSDPFAY